MAEPSQTPLPTPLPAIDQGTEFGARVTRHLREDPVVWLTTVGRGGAPSPNPIWFVWDGASTVRVHSLPDAARLRHLATNPRVTLHFGGDGRGGDIVVLSALATPTPDAPLADSDAEFALKYADFFPRIALTPQTFAQRYSVPITITLTGLRGY